MIVNIILNLNLSLNYKKHTFLIHILFLIGCFCSPKCFERIETFDKFSKKGLKMFYKNSMQKQIQNKYFPITTPLSKHKNNNLSILEAIKEEFQTYENEKSLDENSNEVNGFEKMLICTNSDLEQYKLFDKNKIPAILDDLTKINDLMHFRLPIYQLDQLHLKKLIRKIYLKSSNYVLKKFIEDTFNIPKISSLFLNYEKQIVRLHYLWNETYKPYQLFSNPFKKNYLDFSNICVNLNKQLQEKMSNLGYENLIFFLKVHLLIICHGNDFFYCYNFSRLNEIMFLYNEFNDLILKTIYEFIDINVYFDVKKWISLFVYEKNLNDIKNEYSKYLEILIDVNLSRIKLLYLISDFKIKLNKIREKSFNNDFCDDIKRILELHKYIKNIILNNFSYFIFDKMPIFN